MSLQLVRRLILLTNDNYSYAALRARHLRNSIAMKNTPEDDAIFRAAYDMEMSKRISPQGNHTGLRGIPRRSKDHRVDDEDSLFIQDDPRPRLKRSRAAIEVHKSSSDDDVQEIDGTTVHAIEYAF